MILQQSLARLFNSHWHKYAIVAGKILQQSLVRLLNSRWHNCSTVTGTIVQQSRSRFFFLCWQNSSTVMFTVEESCLVPGIRHMIRSSLFFPRVNGSFSIAASQLIYIIEKKIKFHSPRESSMTPSDKELQWVNVKQKPFRQIQVHSDIMKRIQNPV